VATTGSEHCAGYFLGIKTPVLVALYACIMPTIGFICTNVAETFRLDTVKTHSKYRQIHTCIYVPVFCSRQMKEKARIQIKYLQDTDKIQALYMHIQICVYVYVSDHDIQTSYRLNSKTILFIGESHTYTFKQIHAHSDLSLWQTDMYVSNTDMSV
jgi:hypothetical protein